MEDRQVHLKMQQRSQREADPVNYVLSENLHMVGWREHQMLIAEGHYRCPHCRRADTMENAAFGCRR